MIRNYFLGTEPVKVEEFPNGITRRVLAHDKNLMICEVHFGHDGIVADVHSHPHEQITYILSGEFEFTIGDEKRIVKAGDSMYKEPNVVHGAVCIKAGVLLDIFTPRREEFL